MAYDTTDSKPTFRMVLDALESQGFKPKQQGSGWISCCPGHDDHSPSLSIKEKSDDGTALLHCFSGCGYQSILESLGLWNTTTTRKEKIIIPYHIKKHVKVHPPAYIDNKESNLIVPYTNGTTLTIYPNGFKMVNSGGTILEATFFFASDASAIDQSSCLLVATGYSTTASIHESTGGTAVMVHSDGTMANVIPILRNKYPDKEITICADYDARNKFNSLAMQYHCRLCYSPMVNNNEKSDFNDLMIAKGKSALCEVIGDAKFITTDSVSIKENSSSITSRIISASDLWNKEFKPIKMIVTPILPEGVTLLVSPPKIGKTRLAGQLALAVASGGYALNHPDTIVNKTCVLFLALESGDRRAQKDMKQMIDNPPQGLFIATDFPKLNKGGKEELESWLDENPSCTLVIIDTLAKVRSADHGKGFMYTDDYEAGSAIKAIADKRGISILLLHHTNKLSDDGKDMMDTVSGSTGVTGSVDHILFLKRNRLEEDGLMTLISRDFEDRQFAMTFKDGLWTLVGAPDEAAGEGWRGDGNSNARSEILVALRNEPMKPGELATKLGKNPSTIRVLLRNMVEAGKLQKRFDGKYSVLA